MPDLTRNNTCEECNAILCPEESGLCYECEAYQDWASEPCLEIDGYGRTQAELDAEYRQRTGKPPGVR